MSLFFVVNPNAGQGRAGRIWERVRQELERRKVEYSFVITREPGEGTHLTRDVVEAGYRSVIAVGGDGTVHEVVNGLGRDTALGVIPAGTGNDFALSLRMPKTPEKAVDVLLKAKPQAIDRPTVNGRPFINLAGIGFDAEVARRTREKPPRGKGALPYVITLFKVLTRWKNPDVVIELDGEKREERIFLTAVGNGGYCAGGMWMCPKADLRDGWFDVCICRDLTRFEALVNLPGIFKGRHIRHPKIDYVRARHIRVTGDRVPLYADGEPLGYLPAEFRLEPRALQVLCPPLPSEAAGA